MTNCVKCWSIVLTVVFAACLSPALEAKVYHVSPDDDWFSVIGGNSLQPGDEVVMAAGVYRDARRLVMGHRGTAERPIVIRAAEGAKAVLHRPDARQNSINIEGAQYLVLRDLEITGGSTGIRLSKSGRARAAGGGMCKFVTLEGLHMHHVGGPAITANHPDNTYEGMLFRRNHIHHTSGHGEGFYLGVNNKPDGSTAGYIFNSTIEGNYIHDLNGPNVSQGDGIEIKDGSYGNVVRDNVIHDTNYPGIIVYGTDGKAPNVVERNVIWKSGDHGIQAAAEAIIRNNIVFDNKADGIYSRAHQSATVGHLQVLHNTVISSRPGGAAVRIALSGRDRLSGPVLIANNALYASGSGFSLRVPTAKMAGESLTISGNVGSGATDGLPPDVARNVWNSGGNLTRDLDDAKFPRKGSALIGAADSRFPVEDDFNGTPRKTARDVGTYLFNARGNPGWKISAGFKK